MGYSSLFVADRAARVVNGNRDNSGDTDTEYPQEKQGGVEWRTN